MTYLTHTSPFLGHVVLQK